MLGLGIGSFWGSCEIVFVDQEAMAAPALFRLRGEHQFGHDFERHCIMRVKFLILGGNALNLLEPLQLAMS